MRMLYYLVLCCDIIHFVSYLSGPNLYVYYIYRNATDDFYFEKITLPAFYLFTSCIATNNGNNYVFSGLSLVTTVSICLSVCSMADGPSFYLQNMKSFYPNFDMRSRHQKWLSKIPNEGQIKTTRTTHILIATDCIQTQ